MWLSMLGELQSRLLYVTRCSQMLLPELSKFFDADGWQLCFDVQSAGAWAVSCWCVR